MFKTNYSRPGRHKMLLVIVYLFGLIVVVLLGALLVGRHWIDSYVDPWEAKVSQAGYEERTARIGRVDMSYAEGPDNGPPLVLLHAQYMDWFDYSRVLPDLSKSFHVYDLDYPGHGKTRCPKDYAMTANQIGTDLSVFIRDEIGEPTFVTGNSSGGLLAVWLAANRPELVRAVVLEDPPLFSSEYPRIKETIAFRSFATSHSYVEAGAHDFLLYWIHSNSKFFVNHIGRGSASLLTLAIKSYRRAKPDAPVEIRLLANDTIRLFIRGMSEYDARFGAAFYDGTWNSGFSHAGALKKTKCPTLLLQANFEVMDDGTLNGAMSREEADRAMSLLPNGTYVKIDASHVVHLDKPREFVAILKDFFLSGAGKTHADSGEEGA